MSLKSKVHVQTSGFAYRLEYQEPVFDLDKLDSVVARAAFAAFRPWGITLENVSVKENPANFGEEATGFSLLGGRAVFSVTPGGCALTFSNVSSADLEMLVKVTTAGRDSVLMATGSEVSSERASVTMHVLPISIAANALTHKFFNQDLIRKLTGSPPAELGFSIYRDESVWVVDKSFLLPSALFLRVDRGSASKASLPTLFSQLEKDMAELLDILDLEV